MNDREILQARVAALETDADKAMKNPMLAVKVLPRLLGEVFGLLRAIINHLPEENPHA